MFRYFLALTLVSVVSSTSQLAKIDDALLAKLKARESVNIVVEFSSTQPTLDKVNDLKFASGGARITFMKDQLETLAADSHKNVLTLLKTTFSGSVNSFWITNTIIAEKLTLEEVKKISGFPEVTHIREEKVVELHDFDKDHHVNAEWGIERIEAPAAWALQGGNDGTGAVVATIDTGVRNTHEALSANWRSEYGWYDPYTGFATPTDSNGVGTHNMGVIVGAGGIGVAPGAQWITCLGCSTSSCTEAALTACGQWVACPTLSNGQSPDCSKAPSVCSNAWGGGRGDNWYGPVISAWHVAGIVPIFGIGNSGPSCGTASSPGDMNNVIGVSSVNEDDEIGSFAARGPSVGGNVKPDMCAPGVNIRSASNTGDSEYRVTSGSSAGPHVAGTAALLFAHEPNLSYSQVYGLLTENADRDLGPAPACGDVPIIDWPNNVYGWGRVNARRSLEAAIIAL